MSVCHITVLCVQPTMMVPQQYVVVGMGVVVMVVVILMAAVVHVSTFVFY